MTHDLHNILDSAGDNARDDDAVFMSLADLFSLLSLAIIYVVLTFGQTIPTDRSESVVSASLDGTGPGKPIDPNDIYVTLVRRTNEIEFRVVERGAETTSSIPLNVNPPLVPEQWLLTAIVPSNRGEAIYLYLPAGETSQMVKALFTDTAMFLNEHFKNVHVTFPNPRG